MGPSALVHDAFSRHSRPVSLFHILERRRVRVLFVCLGNSVRSQMAEGFARAYGGDVFEAHSAGIRPAARVSRRACAVMQEKGVLLDGSYSPKSIATFNLAEFDAIVNLSEYSLPDTTTLVLKRVLRDPIEGDEDAFRDVREDVEQLVRFLIDHFRTARQWHSNANPLYSTQSAIV